MQQRLNKFIASNSALSRRKADELIKNGLVKINGKQINTLGITIDPEKDEIVIDGKKITAAKESEKVYFALNKPANFITSRADELNRQTIMSLLPQIPNLKPVGRLDAKTEGLILLSNDGDFINRLSHPRFECEKEYLVKIAGRLTEEEKQKLQTGILIKEENGYKKTSTAKINIVEESKKASTLRITIHEGRNRQIRKMFAESLHAVKYLKRLRIGKIYLGSLKIGSYRKLTQAEIDAYKSA